MSGKTLDEYMSLPYTITISPSPEGGFAAKVNELPGCITQGETFEEIHRMIEDAKREWILSALEDEMIIPLPESYEEKFSGKFNVRVPKSLHRQLAEQAAKEGVSLNQYIVYQLSRDVGLQNHKTPE